MQHSISERILKIGPIVFDLIIANKNTIFFLFIILVQINSNFLNLLILKVNTLHS